MSLQLPSTVMVEPSTSCTVKYMTRCEAPCGIPASTFRYSFHLILPIMPERANTCIIASTIIWLQYQISSPWRSDCNYCCLRDMMLCSMVERFHQNADIRRITRHYVSYKCNHNVDTYMNCSSINNL